MKTKIKINSSINKEKWTRINLINPQSPAAAVRDYIDMTMTAAQNDFRKMGLTHEELMICTDALNGIWIDGSTLPYIWAEVDEFTNGKYPELIQKLKNAGFGILELYFYVKEFWREEKYLE